MKRLTLLALPALSAALACEAPLDLKDISDLTSSSHTSNSTSSPELKAIEPRDLFIKGSSAQQQQLISLRSATLIGDQERALSELIELFYSEPTSLLQLSAGFELHAELERLRERDKALDVLETIELVELPDEPLAIAQGVRLKLARGYALSQERERALSLYAELLDFEPPLPIAERHAVRLALTDPNAGIDYRTRSRARARRARGRRGRRRAPRPARRPRVHRSPFRGDRAMKKPPPRAEDEMSATSARVLVVDDEPSIRELLCELLSREGFEVTAVESGELALEVLARERFDVALVDLKLPGCSGLEVLEALGEDQGGGEGAMVRLIMTGYGSVETAIRAMKLGAVDYILKPFQNHDVVALISRELGRRRPNVGRDHQLSQAVRLHEVSEAMSRAGSLDEVYELLIEAARHEIDAQAVIVWDATRRLPGQPQQPYHVARRWLDEGLSAARAEALIALDLQRALDEPAHQGLDEVAGSYRLIGGEAARQLCAGELGEELDVALLVLPLLVRGETLGHVVIVSVEGERRFTEGRRKMIEVLCGRASAALESSRLYGQLERTFKQTIQALANLLEEKDPYTRGHSERVGRYATLLAEALGFSERELQHVADCALMHDIGKMGIRYEDLNKVEPLTQAEYEMFKSHTTRGKWILEPIAFLKPLIPGVYHHHERWDGKGYPVGLSGEAIPLVARILAIADTYDAMTSHRAYRRALPHDVAMREIRAFAGAQFDPALVETFVAAMRRSRSGAASKAQRWEALRGERLGGGDVLMA